VDYSDVVEILDKYKKYEKMWNELKEHYFSLKYEEDTPKWLIRELEQKYLGGKSE
jgi:hypothetical protein